jgi:hypothetical protein
MIRAGDQISKDRGLHLALQLAPIRAPVADGGQGYSHSCTIEGKPYNTNDDAERASGSGAQPGGN